MLQVAARNETLAEIRPTNYLVVANPAHFPQINGVALPPLPGTEAEARGILRQLGNRPVTVLEGKDAAINRMETLLPQSTVVHFATHAIVNDRAPAKSFLAMDSHDEEGRLTAATIYGLHLQASLVVLSACSTGRGRISGDGVSGLSRAFLYAGAASLITTLWDVVDQPTARLIPLFYAGVIRGETRSAALREAQVQLIGDLRKRRVKTRTLSGATVSLAETPAYWAAFSLAGHP